jgi:ABC-type microcin C transport system duplicated ATPase subunit YejF
MSNDNKILSAVDLSVSFKVSNALLRAVDSVNFYVNSGETVAIVA